MKTNIIIFSYSAMCKHIIIYRYNYIANLDCHDLNVSALAALAPPIILKVLCGRVYLDISKKKLSNLNGLYGLP